MNRLDVVIALLAVAAGFGGWRLGLVARLAAWVGLVAGIVVAARFVPWVVRTFGGSAADDRIVVTLVFLGVAALVGQTVGRGAGVVLRGLLPGTGELRPWDRFAGALTGDRKSTRLNSSH